MAKQDQIRVLRIYEFVGDREVVERQVAQSIQGERQLRQKEGYCIIRAATIGTYPEILERGTNGESETSSN